MPTAIQPIVNVDMYYREQVGVLTKDMPQFNSHLLVTLSQKLEPKDSPGSYLQLIG